MINIIPLPLKMEPKEGYFVLNQQTKLILDRSNQELVNIASQFNAIISSSSTFEIEIADPEDVPELSEYILFKRDPDMEELGDEGYHLSVNASRIIVTGMKPAGVFYGMQALRQLFPPALEDQAVAKSSWEIPCVEIDDKPRFPWRGNMLDVSRHFLPLELIKKNIDYLARYRMNTFHWHLTDDQGWRIEIKKYPKLTEIGAWRVDRNDEPWWGREPAGPDEQATYGGYYTQEEIQEIIQYAADRYITIIPEIDMPGHSQATIAAHPEISCDGGPYYVATGGVASGNTYCPGKEVTFEFVEGVLDEVLELFPGPYFHVGGDECNKSAWEVCPDCQKRIADHGLSDEHELQSYFITRVEKLVNARGKKMIGWDEILEGGLAPNATVMSWRGEKGGIAAAKMGHDVVMSPFEYCYLDLKQGDPELEPPLGYNQLKLSTAYSYDPVPKELDKEEKKHILGTQGNLWGESIQNEEHMNYMMFPRLLAIAEVGWTPAEKRQWDDFVRRLEFNLQRLDNLGIEYARSMYNVSIDIALENNGSGFKVGLNTEHGKVPIHYTQDGSDPKSTSPVIEKALNINQTTQIKAAAFRDGNKLGKITNRKLKLHLAAGKKVKLENSYNDKYPPSNDITLTDCLRGSISYKDGKWLGFEEDDFIGIIDFEKPIRISRITLGVLEDQGPYIFLPKRIEVALSDDGNHFQMAGFLDVDSLGSRNDTTARKDLMVSLENTTGRYVRVHAFNLKACPAWHPGGGGKSWLFIDEIIVE